MDFNLGGFDEISQILDVIENKHNTRIYECNRKQKFLAILTTDKVEMVEIDAINYKDASEKLTDMILDKYLDNKISSCKLFKYEGINNFDVSEIYKNADVIKKQREDEEKLKAEYEIYKKLKKKFE